jgi:hypothetical protein
MSSTKKDRKIRPISGKIFLTAPTSSRHFAEAIAGALRQGFGGTHAAVKTVVSLTGANERSVKNWFDAKNGPSGEHLVDLARHSDDVLEAFLMMSGRGEVIAAKKMVDARRKLHEMLVILDQLEGKERGRED